LSLVGDALRKARQEAALRDARQLGSNPLPPLARPVRRSRLGLGLLVGLLAGAAVAIAGGAAVWWAVGRGGPEEHTGLQVQGTLSTGGGAAAGSPAPSEAPPDETTQVAGTRPRTEREIGAASSAAAPAVAAAPVVQPQPPPPIAAREHSSTEVRVAPPQSTPTPRSREWTGTREFVLDADVGSKHLSLGYIVYRETDPFAEINGQEVHVGSQVEGLTVVSIEADRVTLRGLDRTVVLRTR